MLIPINTMGEVTEWRQTQPRTPRLLGRETAQTPCIAPASHLSAGQVSHGEKMSLRGTKPESFITEHNSVYKEKPNRRQLLREGGPIS